MSRGWLGIVLLMAAGCNASPGPSLYVGQVGNFSATPGTIDQQANAGLRLALEDYGPDGVPAIHSRPLAVRHADTHGNLELAKSEAVRLVTVNGAVLLLGGLTRDEVADISTARVPVLAFTGFRSQRMGKAVFLGGLSPAFKGQALAKYCREEKKLTRMVLVHDHRFEDARPLVEAFRKEWNVEDANRKEKASALREVLFQESKNLAELGATVLADTEQGVVFVGGADDFKLFCKNMTRRDKVAVFAGDESAFDALGDYPLLVTASAFAIDKETPKTEEFAKKFQEKNKEAPTAAAAIAYDQMRLAVEALQKAQTPTPERLRDELLRIKDFAGVTGTVAFSEDYQLVRPAFVGTVEKGKLANAKKYTPK